MSIRNFYKTAYANDFARQFQFRLMNFGNIDFSAEDHLLYVETASLPGRSINNVTVPYMGMTFNTPGTVSYPGSAGWNVTFRCDQAYKIRAALESASFALFDEATSSGSYGMPDEGVTLTMALLGKTGKAVRTYTLFGVWVQALADAPYDIKDTGTVQTIQATLAYQFWRSGVGATAETDPGVPFGGRGAPRPLGSARGVTIPAANFNIGRV
jgi:hypothetical protein